MRCVDFISSDNLYTEERNFWTLSDWYLIILSTASLITVNLFDILECYKI
jgi:hypothetical protein